jgi:hypothetical protein
LMFLVFLDMKNFKNLAPDVKAKLKRDVEKLISKDIRREFPEIANFGVEYDVDKQLISFDGLTLEQEAYMLQVMGQKP